MNKLFVFLALGVLVPIVAHCKKADARVMNSRIGRGINMGNMLEGSRHWYTSPEDHYFDLVKEAGFTSVRIPVRWSAHAQAVAPYTINKGFFKRIDRVVEQALSRGLVVILNVHHYKEFMKDPAAHEERLLGFWSQIAQRYKDQPRSVMFEILNEPSDQVTSELWNRVQNRALKLIRETNPDRIVFVSPLGWNRIEHLKDLELPADDPNLIASVHFYEPFWFTHQGAKWVEIDIPEGRGWDQTPEQEKEIIADLDEAVRWSEEHKIPINVGEFGAYGKADMESRVRWTAFLRREMEKRGMSWNYWEFYSSFGVYDPVKKVWRTGLIKALFLK